MLCCWDNSSVNKCRSSLEKILYCCQFLGGEVSLLVCYSESLLRVILTLEAGNSYHVDLFVVRQSDDNLGEILQKNSSFSQCDFELISESELQGPDINHLFETFQKRYLKLLRDDR